MFIRPLQDLGELQEGRNAHLEGQLTPVSDPTMKVEWYKDGRPITASQYNNLKIKVMKLAIEMTHFFCHTWKFQAAESQPSSTSATSRLILCTYGVKMQVLIQRGL